MKPLTHTIAALAALCAVSCNNHLPEGTILCQESPDDTVSFSFVCELGEEIKYQSMVQKIQFVDDTRFIALSYSFPEPIPYIYNIDGEQLSAVGRIGRAGGEFMFPSSVAVDGGFIYLSCSQSRKILKFDLNGKFVEEYKKFKDRRADIAVTEDYIYLYNTNDHNVELYDRAQREIVGYIGEFEEAAKALHSWSATKPMCEYGEGVLYVDPVTLTVNRVVGEQSEQLFILSAPNYSVDRDVNFRDLMSGPEYAKMQEYSKRNSTVHYVAVSGEKLYIVVHHGDTRISALISVDMSSRTATYRPIADPRNENCIISSYHLHSNTLYALMKNMDNDMQFVAKLNL
ncbi:MAG: 6-bladed beta-propeller [Rikenellaceae bacterium]